MAAPLNLLAMIRRFPVPLLVALVALLHACGGGEGPDSDGSMDAGVIDTSVADAQPDAVPAADRDDDGLSDADEAAFGTDPDDPDTDGDSLSDGDEVYVHDTDPTRADTDDDGISDAAELADTLTDPRNADTDGDGLFDPDEILDWGADPTRADTDGDTLIDSFETARGTSPSSADSDGDGLFDAEELFDHGTDPTVADTDADGVNDGDEVLALGTSPLFDDTDLDGLPDGEEPGWGADPTQADTDDDGVEDGDEVFAGTDPARADTDDDGLGDGEERALGTNPLAGDTDDDGLPDGADFDAGASPLAVDSDGDGLTDLDEVSRYLTAPDVIDTDADGIDDATEIDLELDALDPADADADADDDGLRTLDEVERGTLPFASDTDQDGLFDGVEVDLGTDPLHVDSDEDGLVDGDEVARGTDPLDADSDDDTWDDGDEPGALEDLDGDGLVGALDADSDGDGWPDADETRADEDIDGDGLVGFVDPDSDGDEIVDGTEIALGLDPFDPADAALDPDEDGLTNREEAFYGTMLDNADSDGDELRDLAEIVAGLDPLRAADAELDPDNDGLVSRVEINVHGTHPLRADTDGDGFRDGREVALGSSPIETDSDDDGVPDGDEREAITDRDGDGRIGLLDDDSDGDGVSDYDEWVLGLDGADTDGDGVSDEAERLLGTDPLSRDSDGDGLTDGEEREGCRHPAVLEYNDGLPEVTDAARFDTDGDGVDDGTECRLGLLATVADTDLDGLTDGEELRPCVDAECDDDPYVRVSDPLRTDTDGDGIRDGFDATPSNADRDGDGLLDGNEWSDGANATIRSFDVADGEAFVPDPLMLPVPGLRGDWFAVLVEAAPIDPLAPGETREATPPTLTIDVDGTVSDHALRWDGPRFVVTRPAPLDRGAVGVELTGDDLAVTRVALLMYRGLGLRSLLQPMLTFADTSDSDGDGLSDGDESTGAVWYEAEHHAVDRAVRTVDPAASSGRAVNAARGVEVFRASDDTIVVTPEREYALYVRARATAPLPADALPLVQVIGAELACSAPGPDPVCGTGYCSCVEDPAPEAPRGCFCEESGGASTFTPTEHWAWIHAATFRPQSFDVGLSIREGGAEDGTYWQLDRVMIAPTGFVPGGVEQSYDDIDPALDAVFRVPGVDTDASLVFARALPWDLSDPMEADTDGDGMRIGEGVLLDSVGWLTDGMERTLRTNPLSTDSDGDARFGVVDAFAGFIWDGETLTFTGTPDGRPDFGDAADPSPRPLDTDGDGILDAVEIRQQLARLAAACASCEPEDFDTIDDLDGHCVERYVGPTSALPLCDYADDDRDDDGLRDGDEDTSRDGVVDAGERDPNRADTDGDCIPDGIEAGLACPDANDTLVVGGEAAGCGGYRAPADGGRPDGLGFVADADPATRTSATQTDSDGDGISDGDGRDGEGRTAFDGGVLGEDLDCNGSRDDGETAAHDRDTDGDGIDDATEATTPPDGRLDPLNPDTDGDGLLDGLERSVFFTSATLADTDGDGLDDGDELDPPAGRSATNPLAPDSDGDSIDDGDEVFATGPLASCDWVDVCGVGGTCDDGTDCVMPPTDPARRDTDGDGIDDGDELLRAEGDLRPRTNPARRDTDGDGLTDRDERDGTGPLAVWAPTDMRHPDTDRDGVLDGFEVERRTDPNDPDSRPATVSIGLDGVQFELEDLTLEDGVLSRTGRIPLACPDAPAVAFFDGRVELRPQDGRYALSGDGDLIVRDETGADLVVWSGRTRFSPDATEAMPDGPDTALSELTMAFDGVELRFDPPSCDDDVQCLDGACVDGTCEGTPGVDAVDLCTGELRDEHVRLRLVEDDGETPWMDASGARIAPRAGTVTTSRVRRTSALRPTDFPWEGRACLRSPEVVRVSADLVGDIRIDPNPDLSLGDLRPPGVPRASFGGIGSLSIGGLGDLPLMHLFTNLGLSAPDGSLRFRSPFDFDANLVEVDPDFGALSLGRASVASHDECQYDLDGARFVCPVRYERRTSPRGGQRSQRMYKFEGMIGLSGHGLVPFQTDASHTFDDLACGDGVDLCQDGHLDFQGVLEVPLKKFGLVALIDGLLVADLTTRDGDPLFAGVFGTLSYTQEQLRAVGESGRVEFPFPLSLEIANATSAVLFDETEQRAPERIVFFAQNGFSLLRTVQFDRLPPSVLEMFDPNRAQASGCLDIESGILEATTTIWPANFRYDTTLQLLPPVRDGAFDASAGGIQVTGRVTTPVYFGGIQGTMTGRIELDGGFRFTGAMDDALSVPGFGDLAIPNAQMTIANDGASLTGRLPLPGFGDLSLAGSLTSRGGFDFGLRGELRPLGLPLSEVTGRLRSGGGLTFGGVLQMPLDMGRVTMTGRWSSPTNWQLTSAGRVSIPLGGLNLSNAQVTLGPSGLRVAGGITLPGWPAVAVTGTVGTDGSVSLTGTLDANFGPVSFGGGSLTLSRSGSGTPRASAVATVRIVGISLGRVAITVEASGAFSASGRISFVGQSIPFSVSRGADGTISGSGAVSVNPGSRWLPSGEIRVSLEGTVLRARFSAPGVSLDVDANGCVRFGVPRDCGPASFVCDALQITVCM